MLPRTTRLFARAATCAPNHQKPTKKIARAQRDSEKCPIYKTEFRAYVPSDYFFPRARPMHQGGRNGATKPPFRARKVALTSVGSKVRNFSNNKIGGKLEKNAQSTKPNSAPTCRASFFFDVEPVRTARTPKRPFQSLVRRVRFKKKANI